MNNISSYSNSIYPPISSQSNTLSSIVGYGRNPADSRSSSAASSAISKTSSALNAATASSGVGRSSDAVSYVNSSQIKNRSVKKASASGATAKQQEQVKKLLRELKEQDDSNKNPFAVKKDDKNDVFTDLLGVTEDEEDKEKSNKPVVYNYKEVASKIQRAKTSVSAAQAVFAAKRKVMEVKRKISTGDGDPEELQLALTHAKRMEMVARKKKNHLELEEMSGNSVKRNEREDKQEDILNDLKNSIIAVEEEKTGNIEDEIFEDRQAMIEEAVDSFSGTGLAAAVSQNSSDDMMAELNEMISEFGEEELEELEKTMEMLEDMEVVDPHMDREDLDEMKKKHRMAEQKALIKADMDYLRGMIKHQTEKVSSPISASLSQAASISSSVSISVSSVVPAVSEGATIDVSV